MGSFITAHIRVCGSLKLDCQLVNISVNGWFRYLTTFDAAIVLKLTVNGCSRHAGVILFKIADLLLKVYVKLPGLAFINASFRNECIETAPAVIPVPSFNGGGSKVLECAVRSNGSLPCGITIKGFQRGVVFLESWDDWRYHWVAHQSDIMLFFLIHKRVLLYFFLKYKEIHARSRVMLCGRWKNKIRSATNLHELTAKSMKTVSDHAGNGVNRNAFWQESLLPVP